MEPSKRVIGSSQKSQLTLKNLRGCAASSYKIKATLPVSEKVISAAKREAPHGTNSSSL
jgi:hypothetical protein